MGQREAAKRRNKARKQNWEHQLRVRKQNWYQNLSIWGAQRNKYYIDLNENDIAAQRGYSQAQVQLNDEFAKVAQANEGALIKYLQSTGKLAAAGRTGRSIQRLATLDLGALERSAGRNYYKLTRSRQSFKAITENIRRQQMSQRNQLHANVAFAPVPDLAPPAPRLEAETLGVGDYLKAGFKGVTSYMDKGGKFGNLLGGNKSSNFWSTGGLKGNFVDFENTTDTKRWFDFSQNNSEVFDSWGDFNLNSYYTS